MNDMERDRHELARELTKTGERPDASLKITRRTFLHKSIVAGAVTGAATYGWFPLINTLTMGFGAEAPFSFAWISDTHLYPKNVNTRFVEKATRAVKDVQAMKPAADFLIFGGDLAQLGDPVELRLGNDILKEITVKKHFIPGEHDWYLDMGKTWVSLFGAPPWTFEHKGVTFIGLDTVSRAPDYWSPTKMTPKERMDHMATLDGSVAGAWAGVGTDQLQWLNKTLSPLSKDQAIVIFTHNPLYEYYPQWNFWVRDWRQVHEVLKPYTNVTNIHGHTHQVLYNEIGRMRSIGMLATSWPWPYAPEGVPVLTKPMIRVNPGDIYDGVGWGKMTVKPPRVDYEYMMWRKEVYATAEVDSGTGDNDIQRLRPRIADQMWPYK